MIARGDAPSVRPVAAPLLSPLRGVPNAAWSALVRALQVQALDAVSESGGFGLFDLRPRRLVELGAMTNLRVTRRGDRQVWVADFVLPLTKSDFLASRTVQYRQLARSLRDYDEKCCVEKRRVAGLSRSGMLAVLHVAGTGGLRGWERGKRFDNTVRLVQRANGIF